MQLTTKVKLKPTKEQRKLLLEIMELYNRACNRICEIAFNANTKKQFEIHYLCYKTIREEFPSLSSQMVVRAIAKVAGQLKREFAKHTFKPHGAIQYDSRTFSFKAVDEVSLWCIGGRQRIKMIMTGYQKKSSYESKKQANLLFVDNQFYLLVVIDTDEEEPIITDKVIGVDFGIVEIATLSDGTTFSGAIVESVRKKYSKLRASLQRKGTKSAKAKLKGITVFVVNPQYTSQTCRKCGNISRSNRKSQSIFKCTAYGFTDNADINAACNIASRAVREISKINQPIVTIV